MAIVRTTLELADAFPRITNVISVGSERGLHTGGQLYVSRNGDPLIDTCWGESRPGIGMTPDTVNLWLSAGKPLTAAMFMRLIEQGLVRLHDPVISVIPDFEAGGKEGITFYHLLTHTCGIRNIETGYPEVTWDESIRRICAAPLEQNWIVGTTAGYHTTTSWFILGEAIQRLTGRRFADVMQNDFFCPLSMKDTWAAIPEEKHAAYGDKIGWLAAREQGGLKWLDWHEPSRCKAPSPGSNIRGPIRELGLFYEMMLNRGEVVSGRILSSNSVTNMTMRHRIGSFDQTLGHVVDFGLGVIIDSNLHGMETVPYGYGRFCSDQTFGHGGAQSSQGWCDPHAGLVVAYFFNGRAGEGQHHRRGKSLNEAIYLDLGLSKE